MGCGWHYIRRYGQVSEIEDGVPDNLQVRLGTMRTNRPPVNAIAVAASIPM
jgi:hypothetical protein